jgi:hypothetical protein
MGVDFFVCDICGKLFPIADRVLEETVLVNDPSRDALQKFISRDLQMCKTCRDENVP